MKYSDYRAAALPAAQRPAARRWMFLFTLMAGLAIALSAMQAHAQQAPDALVKQTVEGLLTSIKADAEIQAGNAPKLLRLVDQQVLPNVDFETTTRLAAGRHWRDATPAQQQALVKEFRATLVRTYSGAVSAVRPQTTVALLPFRAQPADTDVVVRTTINQPNGEPIQVDYRLEKRPDSSWKIYDVNVLGVWLIQNYRNQFSQEIQQKGFDGLIKSLADRNRQSGL
jgi:phospholipid transport system substrate-binding protein